MTSTASRLWHGALAAITATALVVQIVLVVDSGSSLVDFVSYFTIQSNTLVLVAAVLIALGRPWQGTAWRLVRLAGLTGITVTGVVYTVAIGPYVSMEGAAKYCDWTFHYVVPLAAVVGHVAFADRDRFAWRDLAFIAWPVAWLAYTLVRAEVGSPSFAMPAGGTGRYPYDFLNVDTEGAAAVTVAIVAVLIVLVAVAALYVRFSGRPGNREPAAHTSATA